VRKTNGFTQKIKENSKNLFYCEKDSYKAYTRLISLTQQNVICVFVQITLKLEPLFKRSITYVTENDSNLEDQVVAFGQEHEFADIIWYPNQHKAVYRVDDRVPIHTSGNGVYDFVPFRSTPATQLQLLRTTGQFRLIHYTMHVNWFLVLHTKSVLDSVVGKYKCEKFKRRISFLG